MCNNNSNTWKEFKNFFIEFLSTEKILRIYLSHCIQSLRCSGLSFVIEIWYTQLLCFFLVFFFFCRFDSDLKFPYVYVTLYWTTTFSTDTRCAYVYVCMCVRSQYVHTDRIKASNANIQFWHNSCVNYIHVHVHMYVYAHCVYYLLWSIDVCALYLVHMYMQWR